MVNQATKTGAQNTLRDISRGFTPTYDKDGNITGTTNFGIGMGQPGGLFGQGTTVPGYKIFDKTSPSIAKPFSDIPISFKLCTFTIQ